jgi:hypothetical protein
MKHMNSKNDRQTAPVAALLAMGIGLLASPAAQSMGLRSFVALPVEQHGSVLRLALEQSGETDVFMTGLAYGIGPSQTLLLGMPYRLSPAGDGQLGDISALYRHTLWRRDEFFGTRRLALLAGVLLPTTDDRDGGLQAGGVFTQVVDRHEIDIDALYQPGLEDRPDAGRYDISWQYRMSPADHPTWGIAPEWHGVVELNGRWQRGEEITHQLTLGLQRISQDWVIEAAIVRDLNREQNIHTIFGIRFHF